MSDLCIKSDFTDYYDKLHNDNSLIKYERYLKNCKQRASALKYLRTIGVKTLELKPVNQYFTESGLLVVYTDPKGHNGKGKKILNINDALTNYNNCVASKYIETQDNITVKFLQIGKRRFTLWFKKDNNISLELGKLIDVRESIQEYNRLIGLPIFSIDYISDGSNMVATDFNEVENLELIGMNNYLTPEVIVDEVRNAIITYNKY